MKKGILIFLVIVSLLAIISLVAIEIMARTSSERRYAGLTLREVFPNQKARQLADAAANGDTKKISRLLAAGINVNTTGKYGITPLWWSLIVYTETADPRFAPSGIVYDEANDSRCYRGFAYLLKEGANPNIQVTGLYDNVMYSAADASDPRFLAAAIKAGGDVNLKGVRGTPIFGAIGANGDNVRLLVTKGANLNILDTKELGEPPMMAAAALGDYNDVYYFLIHGADPSIKCSSGQTVFWDLIKDASRLRPRAEAWRKKVMTWLKRHGFRPCASDMKNLPPPGPGTIDNFVYPEPK